MPFPDGSGLITVSDALFGMVYYLSELWAWSLSPGEQLQLPPRLGGTIQFVRKESKPQSIYRARSAALLRYHHIQHRTWGLSAKLRISLDERYEQWAVALAIQAMQFILAHEIAHFTLGHDPEAQADQHISQQNETAADLLGLEFTERAWVKTTRPAGLESIPGNGDGRQLICLAALIAVMSLNVIENALFIRVSHKHPRPETRIGYLNQYFPRRFSARAVHMTESLRRAAERSCDFSSPIPANWWSLAYSSERVSKATHNTTSLDLIPVLDGFNSGGIDAWNSFYVSHPQADPNIVRSLNSFQEGRIREGLADVDVSADFIGEICDPYLPLTFATLRDFLYFSPGFQGYENLDERLRTAIITTRFLEQGLLSTKGA